MNTLFLILTIVFIVVAVAMVLIILVQRTQGGGLAGAFGGAGGAGAETVFGGRVGDALTWATIIAFAVYISVAVALNLVESTRGPATQATPAAQVGSDPETVDPIDTTGQPGLIVPEPVSPAEVPGEIIDLTEPPAGGAPE